MPRLLAVIAVFVLLALFAVACSGDDDDRADVADTTPIPNASVTVQNQPDPVQPPVGTPSVPEEGVHEIFVEAAAYYGNTINVALGELTIIRVTNNDQLTHNLRVAGLDGQYDTEDDAVTEPAAIEPGASGELNFAPAIRGAYTFHCDYHPGTMGGQVIVE